MIHTKHILLVPAFFLLLFLSTAQPAQALTESVYGFGGFSSSGEPCFGGSPSRDMPADWNGWGRIDGNHCLQRETYTRANDGGRESLKITVNPNDSPSSTPVTGVYRIVGPLDPTNKYWFVGNSFRYNDNGLVWAAWTFCTSSAGTDCADGGNPSWQSVSTDPQRWNHFEFKNIQVPSARQYLKMYVSGGKNTGPEQTDVYFDDIRLVDEQGGGQTPPPQACDSSNIRLQVNSGRPLGQNQKDVQFIMTNNNSGQGTLNIDGTNPSNSNPGLTNCRKTVSSFGSIVWSCDVRSDATQQGYNWNYTFNMCSGYDYTQSPPALTGCSQQCSVGKSYEIRNIDDAACQVNDYPGKYVNGIKQPVFLKNNKYNGIIVMKNTGNTTWNFTQWLAYDRSRPDPGSYALGNGLGGIDTQRRAEAWRLDDYWGGVNEYNKSLGWTFRMPYLVPILSIPEQRTPIQPGGYALFPISVKANVYGSVPWTFRMLKIQESHRDDLFSGGGYFGETCQQTINIVNDTPATTKLSGKVTVKNSGGIPIDGVVLNKRPNDSACIAEKTTVNGSFLYPDMALGNSTCLRAPRILNNIAPNRSYECLLIGTASTKLNCDAGAPAVNNNAFDFEYDIPYCPALPPTALTVSAT